MSEFKVSVEAGEALQRRMQVDIPGERIDKEVGSRLSTVGRTAKLKGFRPGKVPPKVIRQHYGDQVRQEVLQEMIESSYAAALQQENLQPAANPKIDHAGIKGEGEDFSFTATFEVFPEIELAGLDALKIERPETDINDADIDDVVETLRKQRVNWSPIDRKAGNDDRVTVDFTGTLNGEPFEGGSGEDVPIVLGQGQMLEDFEKNLQGLKTGDEKSFKLKFPKDYQAKDLAGEKVSFAVTVKEVAEQQLPDVDEEFMRSFGIEAGDIGQFRLDVQRNMTREMTQRHKADVKRQVVEQLAAANPVSVPAALTDKEAGHQRSAMLRDTGITDENDPNAPGIDAFRAQAEKNVRLSLLIGALIKDNGIEVDRQLVKAKVHELCAEYESPDELRKMYFQNPQLLAQVENMVLEEQAFTWLVDKATVEVKTVSFKDLMDR